MILVVEMAVGEGRTETTVYFALDFSKQCILFGDTWLKLDNCRHVRRIRTEGRGMRLVRTCAILGVSVGLAITIVLLSIGTALKVEGIHDRGSMERIQRTHECLYTAYNFGYG